MSDGHLAETALPKGLPKPEVIATNRLGREFPCPLCAQPVDRDAPIRLVNPAHMDDYAAWAHVVCPGWRHPDDQR